MFVVTWDPLREVADLQRSISRLFDTSRLNGAAAQVMPVDVYETADEVVVRADLPGVDEQRVAVQYHGGQLSIRASREAALPEGASWLRQKRAAGERSRSFTLGVPVNADAIEASYAAGVLTVRLPKSPEARPKQITVKASSN